MCYEIQRQEEDIGKLYSNSHHKPEKWLKLEKKYRKS